MMKPIGALSALSCTLLFAGSLEFDCIVGLTSDLHFEGGQVVAFDIDNGWDGPITFQIDPPKTSWTRKIKQAFGPPKTDIEIKYDTATNEVLEVNWPAATHGGDNCMRALCTIESVPGYYE